MSQAPPDSLLLRTASGADFAQLQPLWQALYRHQFEHGMLLQLPEGAYDAWLQSMQPFLGRFAHIVVAELDGQIVGFVAGRLRTLPPYFGSATIGAISEVYISDEYRSRGIGERLLSLGLKWFEEQGVQRVELQVVAGNPGGIKFYRRLGWHEELLQMVWTPGTHPLPGDL